MYALGGVFDPLVAVGYAPCSLARHEPGKLMGSAVSGKSERPSGPAGAESGTPDAFEPGPASVESQQRALSVHSRYYALLRRSRLLGVAFWAATAYFVVWAVPWFPGGLSQADYTERMALTLVFGGICALLGIGTLILRENLRRSREVLLAWSTVYDDTTGLFNRRYFLDRLSLECERARRQGTTFSLILLRLDDRAGRRQGLGDADLQRLASSLVRATRSNDLVALLGGNELAVVAREAPRRMALQVAGRLKTVLDGSLGGSGLELHLGVATYSARTRHPGALLRTARRALSGQTSPGKAEGKDELAA